MVSGAQPGVGASSIHQHGFVYGKSGASWTTPSRGGAPPPSIAPGQQLRTDQAAIGETFVNLSASLNITLDYNESIFYTAANIRWSLSRARNDIMSREAVAVHMPFTQAPRVARTFHALYAWETGDTFAWPELNHTYCVLQEKLCLRDPNRSTFAT